MRCGSKVVHTGGTLSILARSFNKKAESLPDTAALQDAVAWHLDCWSTGAAMAGAYMHQAPSPQYSRQSWGRSLTIVIAMVDCTRPNLSLRSHHTKRILFACAAKLCRVAGYLLL